MDLLISASLIAAFIAGIAALFAPCCVTVLLPTYFASIFKQKRTVFLMTFVFFLGLLTVFIPIGMGATALTMLFRNYHNVIFFGGGLFLLLLGITLTLGKRVSLPMIVHPNFKKSDTLSIFFLGIFSAIASTCCAPVLAGVLALSVLPGSYLWGTIYTLTYVLGMVTPLFILATFLDKAGFTQKFLAMRIPVTYKFFSFKITNTLSNLFSGLMFLVIGVIILYLTFTNQIIMKNTYQLTVNIYVAQLTKFIGSYTRIISEPVWAAIFVLIIVTIIVKAIRQFMESDKHKEGGENHELLSETHRHNCH